MFNSIRIQPDGGEALRPAPLTIFVDGVPTAAHPGETVATALMAAGGARFRTTARGAPRAPVCNMGVCFECVMTVDGRPGTRACMTLVAAGMRIEST